MPLRTFAALLCIAAIAFPCATTPAAAAGTGKLTVRVLDAETGKTIPARLAVRAADGTYPGDRLAASAKNWPGLEAHAVFIPGEQTLDLPAGKTSIIAAHGMEYHTAAAT